MRWKAWVIKIVAVTEVPVSNKLGFITLKEIIFVTSNKGKVATAQNDLKNIRVLPYNAQLIEPRSDNLREIAEQKVYQAFDMVKKPCISLDSGFFIEELKGFPKAYVNHALDTIGIEGILKLMDGVNNRYCEFKACLAYYDGSLMKFFESRSPGTLSEVIKGRDSREKWSDLWYIFIPDQFDKTLAEFDGNDFNCYDRIKEASCIKKFGVWYESI